jgi:hypothetical protein
MTWASCSAIRGGIRVASWASILGAIGQGGRQPRGIVRLNQEFFMAWKNRLFALGLASALWPAQAAIAADHLDGSATGVKADHSTDINDVYAWMSPDGAKVYLIMTVSPAADVSVDRFSNSAYYVFHTASRSAFLNPQATPLDIICGFDTSQKISCWVGSGNANFVSGNASLPAGISSADGKIKVFAGGRKDHFFFNLDGFNEVRKVVKARQAATPITLDANGCALASGTNANGLTTGQTAAVRAQLAAAPSGAAGSATDFFKNLNTLAIVMEVDKGLLTAGGTLLSVWGGTHKKM